MTRIPLPKSASAINIGTGAELIEFYKGTSLPQSQIDYFIDTFSKVPSWKIYGVIECENTLWSLCEIDCVKKMNVKLP